ncbi:hypothetical protein SO802_011980 [Lithocarpus litseifolius]|uniref:CCHC-type domain-containing protein n=1 Tax=Lithocarpus litseifolius TaxID=425828 RepID=A0AAW2D449_9ROSI
MHAAKLVPDAAADDDDNTGVLNGTQGAIDGGGNGSSSSVLEGEVVESPSGSGRKVVVPFRSNKKIVKKKKKIKKMEVQDQSVVVVNDKEEETVEASNMVEPVDPNAVEITDNIVFWKLLLGPRYFDPPDSNRRACFNCGEGHTVANCTAAKRKKPYFVCGSLEHNAKQCSKFDILISTPSSSAKYQFRIDQIPDRLDLL